MWSARSFLSPRSRVAVAPLDRQDAPSCHTTADRKRSSWKRNSRRCMWRSAYCAHPSLQLSCSPLPGAAAERSPAARGMLGRLHPVREKPPKSLRSSTSDTRCSKDRRSPPPFFHRHLALFQTTAPRATLRQAHPAWCRCHREYRGMQPTAGKPTGDRRESSVQSPDTKARVRQSGKHYPAPKLEAAANAERQMSG